VTEIFQGIEPPKHSLFHGRSWTNYVLNADCTGFLRDAGAMATHWPRPKSAFASRHGASRPVLRDRVSHSHGARGLEVFPDDDRPRRPHLHGQTEARRRLNIQFDEDARILSGVNRDAVARLALTQMLGVSGSDQPLSVALHALSFAERKRRRLFR
jgi:hypothetical protein